MEIDVQHWTNLAIQYGIKLITAILIYVIGKWVIGMIMGLVKKGFEKSNMAPMLSGFLTNILNALLLVFVIIAAIGQLGVQTTSLVAIVGAAGLAVGLALQGSLSNFAAGVLMIIFKPFKIGDFIEAGGTMGTVKDIQIFCTVLAHPDNRKIIVPNSGIMGGNIVNFSAVDHRRIDLTFGISYDDNIKTAKDVLVKLCAEDDRILKDPATTIAVAELGDSSVNIVCRPFVKPADYWGVYFDLTEKGKVELEKAGCSIPFPQRDVHIYEEKKAS